MLLKSSDVKVFCMNIFALLLVDFRLSLIMLMRFWYLKASSCFGFHVIPMVFVGFVLRPFYRICKKRGVNNGN